MTVVLVDSNVLLDVLTSDPLWFAWSAGELARAQDAARLAINPVIYAEVSVHYSKIEHLEEALPSALAREPIPYSAAFLAGKAFVMYRRRGGIRRSPLPDFLIGAHAAVAGYHLLTRDAARYRSYFPPLRLIAPD
jgi:hypothetical protein